MAIHVNDRVRVAVTFRDLSGQIADPTTITAKYRDPSANITTLVYLTDAALVKDTTGKYYVDIDVDEAGTWHYRFEGAGAVVAAGEDSFKVDATQF